jgi:hypothetical protein
MTHRSGCRVVCPWLKKKASDKQVKLTTKLEIISRPLLVGLSAAALVKDPQYDNEQNPGDNPNQGGLPHLDNFLFRRWGSFARRA